MIDQRIELDRAVREFFWSLDYQEVRTPLLVKSPGMEPHIRPIELKRSASLPPIFLPTSPEFGMKKLLAKGLPRIFQICSAFRDEPRSPEHHPEFTMLEFYETDLPLEGLQGRVESLLLSLCERVHHSKTFSFQGRKISFETPFKRFRVVDLFLKHLSLDLRSHQSASMLAEVCAQHQIHASSDESWDDLYFRLWLNLIEPKLPKNEAYFITHYPLSQSSLCNPIADETGFLWANRFEIYVGQTELGNAFDELRDASIQRKNFKKDQEVRRSTYGDTYPESPIDDELLAALPLMKPTTGIAIGLDRIAMLLLDAKTIDEVLYLQSFWT